MCIRDRFRSSIMRINLSIHLRYRGRLSWFSFSFMYFTRAINTVKVIWGDYQCIFRTLLSCSTVILFYLFFIYLVLSYMFERNKLRRRDGWSLHSKSGRAQYLPPPMAIRLYGNWRVIRAGAAAHNLPWTVYIYDVDVRCDAEEYSRVFSSSVDFLPTTVTKGV